MTTRALPSTSASLAFGQNRFVRWAASTLRAADRLSPDLAARLAVNLFFTPLPTKLRSRQRVAQPWRVEHVHSGKESFTLLHHRLARAQATQLPRVLLVHGWAGDALQMEALGTRLAAAGFEPTLMDLPAHGRSAGWRCTMPQIVRSLFEAQARCGPFESIIAHSMGAVASLHAVAHGLSAQRLVLLAPSSPPESVLRWFGEAFGLTPALLGRMRGRIQTHEQMALEQFEAQWLGARVKAPVLLVHDRGDRMAPVGNSEALHRALPAARFHATEGLSHRRILNDPQVIQMALAHLAATRLDGAL
jgi:pimeloyl-ACP methyl ester carboxylesterase